MAPWSLRKIRTLQPPGYKIDEKHLNILIFQMGIENIYNYKLCKVHAFRKGRSGAWREEEACLKLIKLMGDGKVQIH